MLQTTPSWVLGSAFLILQLLACEFGFVWHHRSVARGGGDYEAGDEMHVLAAALGLLALMIAFTFDMAQGRYEDRRQLVVDEANAIVQTYLQSQLLDNPGRDALGDQMRKYVDIRLSYFQTGGDPAKIAAYDEASKLMHVELWRTMLRATEDLRGSTTVPLIAQPMARLVDAQADRRSSRVARVPAEVMQALTVYSLITAFTLGYIMGNVRTRHRIASTILFVLTTVSIMVTLDLDNPVSGGIQLSAEPLLSAREVLHTELQPAAATARTATD
ncbi:MAG TPA: DUF4239 domain-containing protein [Polymorphobacter sp.]|nr:DUF4239 domain-containing protein [Polymorphobacter sp.]